MDLQLCHQQQVQYAERFVIEVNYDGPPRWRMGEKIAPPHQKRAAIAHVDRERAKGHRAVNVAELLDGHAEMILAAAAFISMRRHTILRNGEEAPSYST